MPPLCRCPACQLRRLSAALVLIAIGGLILVHLLHPAFNGVAVVGGFFVFAGILLFAQHAAPRPENPPHRPRGSIFGALFLLTLGVLMLLSHALPGIAWGQWIARYWPVLLILWGITRLIEHYTLPPRARAGLSGGEILLVVLIVVFGLGFSGVYSFGHSRLARYWGFDVGGWNPFYDSFHFTASARAALPAPAKASLKAEPSLPVSVLVQGYRGNVRLTAAPDNAINASLQDTVRAETSTAARDLFQRSQPEIVHQGEQWIIRPAGSEQHGNIEADLELALPSNLPVTVQLENGDVTVPAWGANLVVHSVHGSVKAGHIQGNVEIHTGHDSVSLDQVAGSVVVSGSGDDISIANVTGAVALEGEFVGSLHFRNLTQGIQFHSSRTGLTIAALPGSLNYDMGHIRVTNVRGLQLRTRDETIEVNQFAGPLELHNRNDSIRLSATAPPTAPITVTDANADITLTLPASSSFELQARARNGDVHNDFPAASGGVPVHLETSNGTIRIHKSS